MPQADILAAMDFVVKQERIDGLRSGLAIGASVVLGLAEDIQKCGLQIDAIAALSLAANALAEVAETDFATMEAGDGR